MASLLTPWRKQWKPRTFIDQVGTHTWAFHMAWLAGAHGTVISSIIFFPWNASGQQEGPLKGKTQESTTQNELRPLKDILQPQGLTSCSTRYHILCQLSSWRCTLNAKDGKHLVSSGFSLSLCVFWNLHPVRYKSETQVPSQKIHQELEEGRHSETDIWTFPYMVVPPNHPFY